MADQLNDLMTKDRNVEISASARDFEDDIATYIYPRNTPIVHGPKFANLMLWLDTNVNKPEGKEPNKKWNALKHSFGWNDKHKMVLHKMLDCRMKFKQEKIDFEATFNNEERECRDNILRMHSYIKSISS
jgi:hypothetical protein